MGKDKARSDFKMKRLEDLMDNARLQGVSNQEPPLATREDAERENRIGWWREARFGMFIHWGLYSLPGGIWKEKQIKATYAEHLQLRAHIPIKEYETIAQQFQPDRFHAEAWVKTAKRAGMKYMIVTAKHHDGFAMYDSKVDDYNIVKATPFGRDSMKELAEACRQEG